MQLNNLVYPSKQPDIATMFVIAAPEKEIPDSLPQFHPFWQYK
ncbi:hypothetical protein PND81_05840 [Flavonifractor plautii]|nr:hypothetical protein [Flavonifractor plautii]MDB7900827.1 hypothetical protein [Flavonifractor plautii]